MNDEIVRVKKADLEALVNANTEAYNLLDEITHATTEVEDKVRQAFRTLELAPSEVNDIIVEDEDPEKEEE